jgi:hypothetical protein
MQRIPNRFRAHNILKPGISRVTVAYIIDVLDYGNLLVSRGRNHQSTTLGCVNPRCLADITEKRLTDFDLSEPRSGLTEQPGPSGLGKLHRNAP